MKIALPLKVVNTLNQREHWSSRARRAKKERALGYMVVPAGLCPPLAITLTRIYPKRYKPMDTDGLTAAFKAIRDGIADKIGIDDGSDQLTWIYAQETGAEFGVTIDIKASEPAPPHSASTCLSVP